VDHLGGHLCVGTSMGLIGGCICEAKTRLFAIGITNHLGEILSVLCTPRLYEKDPTVISWAVQGVSDILRLYLCHHLCLCSFFAFSVILLPPMNELGAC